jgi:hypothetical protein
MDIKLTTGRRLKRTGLVTVEVMVWKAATSKADPRKKQDWIKKGSQGGWAHTLAAREVATLCFSPPHGAARYRNPEKNGAGGVIPSWVCTPAPPQAPDGEEAAGGGLKYLCVVCVVCAVCVCVCVCVCVLKYLQHGHERGEVRRERGPRRARDGAGGGQRQLLHLHRGAVGLNGGDQHLHERAHVRDHLLAEVLAEGLQRRHRALLHLPRGAVIRFRGFGKYGLARPVTAPRWAPVTASCCEPVRAPRWVPAKERQRSALERSTSPERSRRTCSPRYGLHCRVGGIGRNARVS